MNIARCAIKWVTFIFSVAQWCTWVVEGRYVHHNDRFRLWNSTSTVFLAYRYSMLDRNPTQQFPNPHSSFGTGSHMRMRDNLRGQTYLWWQRWHFLVGCWCQPSGMACLIRAAPRFISKYICSASKRTICNKVSSCCSAALVGKRLQLRLFSRLVLSWLATRGTRYEYGYLVVCLTYANRMLKCRIVSMIIFCLLSLISSNLWHYVKEPNKWPE